ncbi:MAG: replication-relaxation family protein, partial [Gammaproteobacteria bacterium]
MVELAGQEAAHRTRSQVSDRTASLSPLDLRLLEIVSEHRVVTQTQLEVLVEDVPARTLRYRTRRLHRLGLIGRTRPYRERGSAPFHLWPTRTADALARGASAPRGGERREPSPTFIAHAVAITDFYVALARRLPAGVELVSFAREGEAREPFRSLGGRRRAIAPDARIELEGEDERRLVGLLEVDLGTMSHRRLRAKARGYADYARVGVWRERHDFCPALVFATIAERRALAFLDALEEELGAESELLACACGLAREPERAVAESVWQLLGSTEPVELIGALCEARRPYDEERARLEELRQRDQAERERLRSDPIALRTYLRLQRLGLSERLGEPVRTALELLLEGEEELAEPERGALEALAGMLADPLVGRWAEREPDAAEREALARLADHCRSRQLQEVNTLGRRLGENPALRRARRRLKSGELLSALDLN